MNISYFFIFSFKMSFLFITIIIFLIINIINQYEIIIIQKHNLDIKEKEFKQLKETFKYSEKSFKECIALKNSKISELLLHSSH